MPNVVVVETVKTADAPTSPELIPNVPRLANGAQEKRDVKPVEGDGKVLTRSK
jgi:hypothetical protein